MQPTFRTDLTCSREEQQGVVFYRIDDPETRTSFRLYEIEYLIAQKLDGTRSPAEVIEAVKAEYNFDISDNDLQKFISQLESMGFVRGGADTSSRTTSVMDSDAVQEVSEPTVQSIEPSTEAFFDMSHEATEVADQAELNRMLRTAFAHIRSGYLVHARDYLLAARELSARDGKISELVSHVDVAGADPSNQDLEQIWQKCQALFPEVAAEIGPYNAEQENGNVEAMAEAARRASAAWDQDVKVRVRWSFVVVACLCIIVPLGYYAYTQYAVATAALKVEATTIQGKRIPIYFTATATAVRPVQEKWLSFGSAGKLAEPLVKVGTHVQEGDIVASLEVPPRMQKLMHNAQEGIHKAEMALERVNKRLETMLNDREATQTIATDAEHHIKELRPKTVLKPDAATRKALEGWKKTLDKANKRLGMLTKRERGPRGAANKSKKRIENAKKRMATLQERIADKLLRAPFAGEVSQVKAGVGENVEAQAQVVYMRNPLLTRLVFAVPAPTTLQTGGEALISVAKGNPLGAKISAIKPATQGSDIEIDVVDPAASFLAMKPAEFRLVREWADPVFQVRASALFKGDDGQTKVMVVQAGHVMRATVQVVEQSGGDAIIRESAGLLKSDVQVVLSRVDGQPLNLMPEGTAVQLPEVH